MKKASIYSDTVIWFWRIILVTIISIFILLSTAKYLNADFPTEELELEILKTKLLYSCLKYEDTGEIDLTKINNAVLQKCYLKNNIGYKITLTDMNNKEIKTAQQLSPQQEPKLAICADQCAKTEEYVLYYENNKQKSGILKIGMVKNA